MGLGAQKYLKYICYWTQTGFKVTLTVMKQMLQFVSLTTNNKDCFFVTVLLRRYASWSCTEFYNAFLFQGVFPYSHLPTAFLTVSWTLSLSVNYRQVRRSLYGDLFMKFATWMSRKLIQAGIEICWFLACLSWFMKPCTACNILHPQAINQDEKKPPPHSLKWKRDEKSEVAESGLAASSGGVQVSQPKPALQHL